MLERVLRKPYDDGDFHVRRGSEKFIGDIPERSTIFFSGRWD